MYITCLPQHQNINLIMLNGVNGKHKSSFMRKYETEMTKTETRLKYLKKYDE